MEIQRRAFYALPSERVLKAIIKSWQGREPYVEGQTYNISPHGVVLGVPKPLWGTVIGSQTFGLEGRDVDFGLVVEPCSADRAKSFSRSHVTRYANIITTCEYVEIGMHAFMALPIWRAELDADEYAAASRRVHAMGGDEWLRWKRKDKESAYRAVGISLQSDDGRF